MGNCNHCGRESSCEANACEGENTRGSGRKERRRDEWKGQEETKMKES